MHQEPPSLPAPRLLPQLRLLPALSPADVCVSSDWIRQLWDSSRATLDLCLPGRAGPDRPRRTGRHFPGTDPAPCVSRDRPRPFLSIRMSLPGSPTSGGAGGVLGAGLQGWCLGWPPGVQGGARGRPPGVQGVPGPLLSFPLWPGTLGCSQENLGPCQIHSLVHWRPWGWVAEGKPGQGTPLAAMMVWAGPRCSGGRGVCIAGWG